MRFAAGCLIILLAGCDSRSSFNEQYDETANEIQNRAEQIDNDLNSTTSDSEAESEPSS